MGNERSAMGMVAMIEADKGIDIALELHPKDRGAITTVISVDWLRVADIQIVKSNDITDGQLVEQGRERSICRTRVAGGVDPALVSISTPLDSKWHVY